MPVPPMPSAGEVQIVVLLGTTTFIGWAQQQQLEDLMDSFETRSKLTEADRTNQISQASIRVEIARHLRSPEGERLFTDVLASGCLWLALRHWSNGKEMQAGLVQQMEQTGFAIITASIPDIAPDGMTPDTAWAFMIGSKIHDGRTQLADIKPGEVSLYQPLTAG